MLANYKVELLDLSGTRLALFDDWKNLEYARRVNSVDYAVLDLDAGDSRIGLFDADFFVVIYRSIPSVGVDWYADLITMLRYPGIITTSKGERIYRARTVGVKDLLRRHRIGYKAGTIYADKNDPADTVMKEYVEENCGPSATIVNGRLIDGVYPYFTVEGTSSLGIDWYGSRAYENLLDTLSEISTVAGIDFDIVPNPTIPNFQFRTYYGQLGSDRTDTGMDSVGKNVYGNYPVVFDTKLGNVQELIYEIDRNNEFTVCFVLGDGDGSTRTVKTVASGAYTDTPYNSIETSVNGSGQQFDYELVMLGAEVLQEYQAKEIFQFTPLRNPQTLYGKHFFLGDRLTLRQGSIKRNKRLIEVKYNVAGRDVEKLAFEFADIP